MEFQQLCQIRLQNAVDESINKDHFRLGTYKTRTTIQREQFLAISKYILDNMNANTTVNVRSLYYQFKNLFNNQKQVDSIIKKLMQQLKCEKIDLNLISTAKGLAYGSLNVIVNNRNIQLDQSPSTIDYDVFKYQFIQPQEHLIVLIVEKDTIFQYLVQNFSQFQFPLLIITGKGQPDTYTKIFIQALDQQLDDIIFVGLCDCNYYGHSILYQYRQQIRRAQFIVIGMFEAIIKRGSMRCKDIIVNLVNKLDPVIDQSWIEKLQSLHLQQEDEIDSMIGTGQLIDWLIFCLNKLQ